MSARDIPKPFSGCARCDELIMVHAARAAHLAALDGPDDDDFQDRCGDLISASISLAGHYHNDHVVPEGRRDRKPKDIKIEVDMVALRMGGRPRGQESN